MPTMTTIPPDSLDPTGDFDDLYWAPETAAITENDEFLQQVIMQAELPVLLASIAAALHDPSFLPHELRPPLTPMDTEPHPHGGMDDEQKSAAASLALRGLQRIRDEKITRATRLDDDEVRQILDFLSSGNSSWHDSLVHELDLAPSKGAKPEWSFETSYPGREFPVLIVGAGVAGIAAAHRYGQSGLPYTLVEASNTVGGTWAKNDYPGVRLDTPTFGYSYSFAQRVDWPHQFAEGKEIYEYLRDVAERAGIIDHIEFDTRLIRLQWDDRKLCWLATTRTELGEERTREFSAVVSALGQLDRPNIPEFPGDELFTGIIMHSQEWEHDVDLTGKRVAVIGTGASAYQIVPAVIEQVRTLTVFQRSAPWMLPAPNYHHDISQGFTWLRNKVPHYGQWYRLWVILIGIPGRAHTVTAEEGWEGAPLSISAKNQELREYLTARVERQLAGRPDLLEHAIPNYPPGAKRMLRDNEVWTAALRAEKSTLVTSGIQRLTPRGIVDNDGIEHAVDVVILATGFKPSDYLDEVEVIGLNGTSIHDFWSGDARAYNGVTVPGFPNFFLIYGPNVGGVVAGSLHFMLERAVEFSLKAIREVLERDAAAIDVREEALDRFVDWVDAGNRRMAWGQPYVKTWYQNVYGRVSQIWPYTNVEYWEVTNRIEEQDHRFIPRSAASSSLTSPASQNGAAR